MAKWKDRNGKIQDYLSASPLNLSSTGAEPGSGRSGLTPREGMPATSRGQAWVRGFGMSVLPMVVPLPSLFLPFPILWGVIYSVRMESSSERIGTVIPCQNELQYLCKFKKSPSESDHISGGSLAIKDVGLEDVQGL